MTKNCFCIGCNRKCTSCIFDNDPLPKFCNKTGEEIDFWSEYVDLSVEDKVKELKKVLSYEK